MKNVEPEQSSILFYDVSNDNRLQCILCAHGILDFQQFE